MLKPVTSDAFAKRLAEIFKLPELSACKSMAITCEAGGLVEFTATLYANQEQVEALYNYLQDGELRNADNLK